MKRVLLLMRHAPYGTIYATEGLRAVMGLGVFELNVMLPAMAFNLIQSIDLLRAAAEHLREKCVDGIAANEERCRSLIEESLALCTPLVPAIGYEAAAAIAKQAFEEGRTVREVALANKVLPEDELTRILDHVVLGEG